MSDATPDLVLWRRAIEAGNARDIEVIMRLFAPNSAWDMSSVGLGLFGLIDRTTNFFGLDEARAVAERLAGERG